MPSRTLVHDVRKRRVEVLGVEIQADGEIRIPKAKLDGVIGKLAHRMKFMPEPGAVITGFSMYSKNSPEKGRYRFDTDDVLAVYRQFYDRWDRISRKEAERFAKTLREKFGTKQDPSRLGSFKRHTWVAGMLAAKASDEVPPRPGDGEGGVTGEALRVTCGRSWLRAIFDDDPLAKRTAPSGQAQGDAADPDLGLVGGSDGDASSREEPTYSGMGVSPWPWENGCSQGTAVAVRGRDREGSSPVTHEENGCSSSLSISSAPSGLGDTHRFYSPSPEKLQSERTGARVGYEVPPTGISPAAAAPSPAVPRNVYLQCRWLREAGVTLLASQQAAGPLEPFGEARVIEKRMRPEAATLELIAQELGRAQAEGVAVLVFRMDDPWLAKSLVQKTRKLHSPNLFDRVLRLHEQVGSGGTVLVVAGECSQPPEVASALAKRVREVESAQERRREARP